MERHHQTIVANRWDTRTWQDTVRPMRPVDTLIDDLMMGQDKRTPYEWAPELVQDTFQALYQPSPVIREPQEVAPEVRAMRALMTRLVEHPQLKQLQEMTAGDALMSAVAMGPVGDVLREAVTEAQKREQQKKEKQQKQQDKGDEPGDEPGDQPDGEPDGQPGQDDSNWQQMLDEMDIERKLYRAIDKATEEAEEMEATVKTFGLDPAEWDQMSPGDRFNIAQQLTTSKMRKLADMIGRMVRFAFGVKQTRITDVPHTVYSVERGNNLRNVLPREFALLGAGAGLDFYRRYAARDLAQYKKRGTEKAAKGPLIVCIDRSSSMDGEPMDWAMGAAEAMRRLVAEEGRDYHAIFFGGVGDLKPFDFPKGAGTAEKIIEFCSVKANGGTDFAGPLTAALAHATRSFDAEGRSEADICFLTDGQSALSDEWLTDFNTERARVGVNVHSIFIGGAGDVRSSARDLLDRFSDQVVHVHDLVPESAGSVFVKL